MAKAIMVQGTMSNSGKSFLTAGLCRVFMQDGYKVAPFKSQNMALNSYITKDGLEIGRAQAMQAEACGIEPTVDMNPILLKPTSHVGSQVIVNGEVRGNMKAMDYYRDKIQLKADVINAYNRLSQEYDIIVIEGAGSPAEINLRENDIVNMGMAKMAGAPVLLVGDIDRGGVFAALYGTVKLLEEEFDGWIDMTSGIVLDPEREPYCPPAAVKKMRAAREYSRQCINQIYQSKKIRYTIGTDANHGLLYKELEYACEGGASSLEALKGVTVHAARMCGLEKKTGQIAKGMKADLIAVDDNPLEEIRALKNVRFVMKSGKICKAE